MSRFERAVDPDGSLSESERKRRSGFAKKAYFARLGLKSAQTRAKKKSRK